jgi:hypothetical protein
MLRTALVVIAVLGCKPAPKDEVVLLDTKTDAQPHLEKLQAQGGDVSKILKPKQAADLKALESGKRYKFVVLRDGQLAISPLAADVPNNEYVHPVLGGGGPVRTAGGIKVVHESGSISKVVLDQDSKAYCATTDSLRAAATSLKRIGVTADSLRIENKPPKCLEEGDGKAAASMAMANPTADKAKAEDPTAPRYGALMVEVGQRYELMGKAAKAKRYELAAFELHELEEVFEEDLPRARPPKESAGANLASLAEVFVQNQLPALKKAIESKDPKAIATAYSQASASCNACHQASTHKFVEIAAELGADVPRLDPLP